MTVATALALAASAALTGCTASADRSDKPNIVVIMTDDQWLESMRVLSRTRDLIGGKGVSFARYYASEPICCPSRASYLTGQFAHNNGVRHNAAPQGGYQKLNDENTLPVWLKNAGYATSHIGKYPNGYGKSDPKDVPPGWTEWRGSIDPTTYQMYGYTLNENGKLTTYGKPDVEDPKYYQTDVYRDKAADFITRKSDGDDPFFLSVAFLAPHGENVPKGQRQQGNKRKGPKQRSGTGTQPPGAQEIRVGPAPRPAPRHKGKFANEKMPRPPSYDEADLSDKPTYMRDYPRLTQDATARIEQSYRGRLESLLAVDEAVQKVVDTLEKSGELDNTYLLFTADNGFFFGEHRIPTGKYLPHEVSSHLPFLMRGPGLPAGRTSREAVTNIDLAATIADAAGVEPGLTVDGRSMLPYARRPDIQTMRPLLHEAGEGALKTVLNRRGKAADDPAGHAAAQGDLDQDMPATTRAPRRKGGKGQVVSVAYEAIRTERYLYIRLKSGERELYDYKNDPHELRSVHNDPEYAKVRRLLDRHLTNLQGCQGEKCTAPIPPLP